MLEITLDKLPIGQEGIIQSVGGEGILRRRLLDMGLTPRTRVIVRKRAPLGDPLEIYIRRYECAHLMPTKLLLLWRRMKHEATFCFSWQQKLR